MSPHQYDFTEVFCVICGMRLSELDKGTVRQVFDNYNRLVKMEQDEYLDILLETMSEHDFRTFTRGEADFMDFAIQAYLHNLKNKHDEWLEILQAVVATRDIADGIV